MPSDFGFHNSLRREDGSLAFVDFEYFGWDDPVKLTADILLHPGSPLAASQRRRFRQAVCQLYGEDRILRSGLERICRCSDCAGYSFCSTSSFPSAGNDACSQARAKAGAKPKRRSLHLPATFLPLCPAKRGDA